MKKLIVGLALCLFPLSSYAETTFISEVLMGQSKHNMSSYLKSAEVETNYSSALKDTSFGFRLGAKFLDNFSLELSKHDHGSAVNEFTLIYSNLLPDPSGAPLGEIHDTIVQARIPINIDSIRLGFKGEYYVLNKLLINARVGLSHWEYKGFTPQVLTSISATNGNDESGNDIYYSLGGEYKFTENFYVGFEYSIFNVAIKQKFYDDFISSYKHKVKDISFVIGWAF
jgi:long-subunit fatty acid transport protein